MHAVDMKRASAYADLPAVVRLAAIQAQEAKGYMKPGTWLRNLHQLDLQFLVQLTEQAQDTLDDPSTSALIALTMILVQAEGLELTDDKTLRDQVGQLGAFVIAESLARKGLARIFHDNISFGEDSGDLPIAESLV